MAKEKNDEAFLSQFSSKLHWVALASLVLLVIALLVIVITLKGSVDHVETQLRFRPPPGLENSESYQSANLAKTQSLYVPVYSHVYIHDGTPFRLTATLSIRNTDAVNPLFVQSVLYYDSEGKLVRQYIKRPLKIGPHATAEFLVEERDTSGGSGASFVVEWASENPLTQPVVEAVMIGASSQQGISFVCPAVVVSETYHEPNEDTPDAGAGVPPP